MTVTFGFYNSLNNGDRKYDAVQFSKLFEGIISDGVFEHVGGKLFVTPGTNLNVVVASGRAWFNNTWTDNDAALILPIAIADMSHSRIDAVILEVNSADSSRTNSISIVTGDPGTNPVGYVPVNTGTLHRYVLAYLTVAPLASGFTQANITNLVGTVTAPFITAPIVTVSTSDLLTQWSDQFAIWLLSKGVIWTDWFDNTTDEMAADQLAWENQFGIWTTEKKAAFDLWLSTLVDELDANQAANLQSQINALSAGDMQIVARQGGSADDWNMVGTTNYTPTNAKIQVGNAIALGGEGEFTVTFPIPFLYIPLVFSINDSTPGFYNTTVQIISVSTTGFTARGTKHLAIEPYHADAADLASFNWMAIGPI